MLYAHYVHWRVTLWYYRRRLAGAVVALQDQYLLYRVRWHFYVWTLYYSGMLRWWKFRRVYGPLAWLPVLLAVWLVLLAGQLH